MRVLIRIGAFLNGHGIPHLEVADEVLELQLEGQLVLLVLHLKLIVHGRLTWVFPVACGGGLFAFASFMLLTTQGMS